MPYEITYLADHPDHLETIATWYWEEWDQHEGWNIDRSKEFAKNGCNKDKLDIILLALNEQNKCLGTIQLRQDWGLGNETPEKLKQYNPWLGSLYVDPDYRGKTIGADLCKALMKEATRIGIKKCYAATAELDNFFKLKGGQEIDEVDFAGQHMRVYEFSLGN